ncbi:MAG: flagellar basal body-associated FliL family protein [Nitrospira sp.]|nr:flagellar basal body-associated FliL family protein [Nitrospira sp.]
MADAAATEGKEVAQVAAPPLPIKLIVIVALVALVTGLGGAVVAVKLLGGGGKGAETAGDHGADEDGRGKDSGKMGSASAPGVMVDLDPFIVNLADAPEIRYLKIVIKLEADNEAAANELKARIPQVRDTILVLLSSKDANSVRTAQGKFQLRDEITQRVNGLLPRPGVRGAYFTEFVVQ